MKAAIIGFAGGSPRTLGAFCAIVFFLMPTFSAATQGGPLDREPLIMNQTIEEDITTADPTRDNSQHTKEYKLHLDANQRVQIDMVGLATDEPFDTYLRLLDPQGNEVARNDDRGDGTYNSRIIYTAPATGDYIVRAQGFFSRVGRFQLTATAVAAVTVETLEQGATPVRWDDAPTDMTLGMLGRVREFQFQGRRGERVSFSMASAPFDIILRLAAEDGSELASGFSFESRLVAELPRNGWYRLTVATLPDASGTYPLDFERATPVSVRPSILNEGSGQRGDLRLDSPAIASVESPARLLALYRLYRLELRPRETVRLTVSSRDFVPVVEAGGMTPLGFGAAVSGTSETEFSSESLDDPPITTSRLTIQSENGGDVLIRVRSEGMSLGDFEFTVEREQREGTR